MSGDRRPPGTSPRSLLVVLVLVVLVLGLGKYLGPDEVPISALTIPVMVGGWRLPRRSVLVLGAFVTPGGGTVITSGCTDWVWGLAERDRDVEQITRNIFDRLG